MSLIYFVIQDFKILFREKKKLLCIILLNFIICFICLFYFFSFYYDNYVSGKDFINEYKPYQIIYNNAEQDIRDIKSIVDELLASEKLPQISKLELKKKIFIT